LPDEIKKASLHELNDIFEAFFCCYCPNLSAFLRPCEVKHLKNKSAKKNADSRRFNELESYSADGVITLSRMFEPVDDIIIFCSIEWLLTVEVS
jgi:hypothetical protein